MRPSRPAWASSPRFLGATSAFGVELRPVGVRDAGEIERAVTAFAREPNGGLIVPASPLSIVQRDLIITLAARHRLPAVYSLRFFVTSGGLISYGPDTIEPTRLRPVGLLWNPRFASAESRLERLLTLRASSPQCAHPGGERALATAPGFPLWPKSFQTQACTMVGRCLAAVWQ